MVLYRARVVFVVVVEKKIVEKMQSDDRQIAKDD
jgi:hypothetical protein